MFESKYSQYITKSSGRFAETDEILGEVERFVPRRRGSKSRASAGGVPLYYDGQSLYVDNSDSHTMIIGPTGCKKTRVTVFSSVFSVIEAGESAIINDPKGEIFERTAESARKRGADVRVLNLRDPSKSDCWNPLYLASKYHLYEQTAEALECVSDFVEAIVAPSLEHTNDRYWVDTPKAFLTGLMLMLLDSVPSTYYNMSNIIQFCYQGNETILKSVLSRMDQRCTAAFGLHAVLDLTASTTLSCVHSCLLSMLNPFIQNKELTRMMCDNTIDLETVGTRQTVIYVIYPDEKASLNFIVNSFLTQSYETLVNVSGKTGARNPVRVNYILDEFSNLPRISLFENRISEARSRNIRYILCIQSFSQLRDKYGDSADTILSNCNNWLCFSSRESAFLNRISELCGREVDYNGFEHPLLSPTDLQYLSKRPESADILVIKNGVRPFVATLPDIDRLSFFAGYPAASLSSVNVSRTARALTVPGWFAGVESGKFAFPYSRRGADAS